MTGQGADIVRLSLREPVTCLQPNSNTQQNKEKKMALTGIQIFKLLPKTNCKECGVPTCLAFAMNLASGKAELDACPYVSDEAREQLAEASAPPIRPVAIGKGVRAATTGGETVQYRHEKTFYNPTLSGGTGRFGHRRCRS